MQVEKERKEYEERQLQKAVANTILLSQAISDYQTGKITIHELEWIEYEISLFSFGFRLDTDDKKSIGDNLEDEIDKSKVITSKIELSVKETKNSSGKVEIKRITMSSEGAWGVNVFKSIKEASQLLEEISKTDNFIKTNFTIEWKDGCVYNGKLCTTKNDDKNIDQHILEHINYRIEKPEWETQERWLGIISYSQGGRTLEEMANDYQEFLDTYSLSDEPVKEN